MKILVIGSGGREHAIIRKLMQSPKCEKIISLGLTFVASPPLCAL